MGRSLPDKPVREGMQSGLRAGDGPSEGRGKGEHSGKVPVRHLRYQLTLRDASVIFVLSTTLFHEYGFKK